MKQNMKQNIKNNLFGFIIGGIIFCGVGVGATSMYYSNQVSYKGDSVEVALDDLYTQFTKKTDSVIYLGSGKSFNISNYDQYGLTEEQYKSLTVNNFVVEPTGTGCIWGASARYSNDNAGPTVSTRLVKSYNASTGVLTAYVESIGGLYANWSNKGGSSGSYNAVNPSYGASSISLAVKIYLIY